MFCLLCFCTWQCLLQWKCKDCNIKQENVSRSIPIFFEGIIPEFIYLFLVDNLLSESSMCSVRVDLQPLIYFFPQILHVIPYNKEIKLIVSTLCNVYRLLRNLEFTNLIFSKNKKYVPLIQNCIYILNGRQFVFLFGTT